MRPRVKQTKLCVALSCERNAIAPDPVDCTLAAFARCAVWTPSGRSESMAAIPDNAVAV
jgi:hypothetical protein